MLVGLLGGGDGREVLLVRYLVKDFVCLGTWGVWCLGISGRRGKYRGTVMKVLKSKGCWWDAPRYVLWNNAGAGGLGEGVTL